jgi:hypothetical protein
MKVPEESTERKIDHGFNFLELLFWFSVMIGIVAGLMAFAKKIAPLFS